ncbi:MAG: T9SS type A sorting domain-containing protein, partial [Ignavibacteriaceae bacterium]|nr:T9SS type A sorting domain-containing protein [Ignavibacteriaceae bacterium]
SQVELNLSNLPESYVMMQNFPNPFNPATKIKYSLPVSSSVNVSVYNSLGELVSELVNKSQPAGYYELNFNASGLASGIYIYKIEALSIDGLKNFSDIKKMMLVK